MPRKKADNTVKALIGIDLPMMPLDPPVERWAVDVQGHHWNPVRLIAGCLENGYIIVARDENGVLYFDDELVGCEAAAIARVRGMKARRILAIKNMMEKAVMEYRYFDQEQKEDSDDSA